MIVSFFFGRVTLPEFFGLARGQVVFPVGLLGCGVGGSSASRYGCKYFAGAPNGRWGRRIPTARKNGPLSAES